MRALLVSLAVALSSASGMAAGGNELAKLLPPGTNVPSFNGTPITVGNIVTHTSGLPSVPWRTTDLSIPTRV
jgi:serine-type D-Ala-D-Ala carboxypeptidase/endopeptidase